MFKLKGEDLMIIGSQVAEHSFGTTMVWVIWSNSYATSFLLTFTNIKELIKG